MNRRSFLISSLALLSCKDELENMDNKKNIHWWLNSSGSSVLPIVSGASGIWGVYKYKSDYTGNAIQIKRASDSTTTNIGFVGNKLDISAIQSFNSNDSISCTIETVYDQSGNGHNLTVQATKVGASLCYDSYYQNYYLDFGYGDNVVYQVPNTLSVNTRDCSLYSIIFGKKAGQGIEAHWDWGTNNLMYYSNDYNSRAIYDGAAEIFSAKNIFNTTDPTVHSVRCTGSNVKLNVDNFQSSTAAVLTSATPTGARIGSWTGSAGFAARYSWIGGVVYTSALSDSDDTSNVSAFHSYMSKSVSYNKIVVCIGDSITAGDQANPANKPLERWPVQVKRQYSDYILFVNSGYSGNTLVQMNTDRNPRAIDLLSLASYTNKVAVVWGGTNDINAGTNGTTTHTNLQTLCNNLRSGGFDKIVVVDMIPRGTFSGAQNTERDTFNSLVAANYTSYADYFLQASALSWSYATHYGSDQVHPNKTGYELISPSLKIAIDSVI